MRSKVLLLLVAMMVMGCDMQTDPSVDDRTDKILEYYMPRSTELRYTYQYKGYYSGKADSIFTVEYRGRLALDSNRITTDGYSEIHQFTVASENEKHHTDIDFFVSDSIIIEYGRDCSEDDERFVPLRNRLRVGERWTAAQGYRAGKGYEVSFIATVAAHYDRLDVANGIGYDDVWQVNYLVTGSVASNVRPAQEFLPNARRAIYFARGIGKVLEVSFSPDGSAQWETELIAIKRR